MRHARSLDEIEDISMRLRERMGMRSVRCPDIISILEKTIPEIYPGFELVRVSERELPRSEAKADCVAKKIYVREVTYRDAQNGLPHARMTLAHELGHIVLGHGGIRHRMIGPDYRAANRPEVSIEEREAKFFAAAFLAPSDLAEELSTADQISEQFQISLPAAEIRLNEIEAQIRRRTGKLRPLPQGVVDFLKEAQRRGIKINTVLDDQTD